jgi:hypothetical protein
MIDVKLSRYWLQKCETFALQCAETNKDRYRSRGQMSIDKIVSDIFVGKAGECAVYLHKKSLGIKCSKPDFLIYHGKKKSYAADLRIGEKLLHVKTQSQNSAEKYGISWILQVKEGDQDKLFRHRSENDLAIFCVMKSESVVTVLAEVSIVWLFDNNLVDEPKLKWFIGTKKAVYWEKVKEKLAEQSGIPEAA